MTSSSIERRDLDALLRYTENEVGNELPPWPGGYPGQIEAALLDAVFSIRARYGGPNSGIRRVITRWQDFRGEKIDDLSVLAGTDSAELARIVNNRAKASGRLKSALVVEAAGNFHSVGLRHAEDFTGSDVQRHAYEKVHGCGRVTWSYFMMLLGSSGVKADTWIIRFVSSAVGRQVSSAEAAALVTQAARARGHDPSQLDHAIWLRARSGNSR